MPKINIDRVPVKHGSGYPEPFARPCADRRRQRLGEVAGLQAFGVNLVHLPAGSWSSQRHWHTHEDEFVLVVAGTLTLVEDEGETILYAGDCAAFAAGSGNGHHLVNRSAETATYLEVGSRHPDDVTYCSDVDMMSANADGRFVRRDGSPL